MEITNALLVAMMFIVLLTIGISNIIMALAALVDKRSPAKADAIHTSWVLMVLLLHLRLFWHVLDILSVETWTFLEFLYIVAGAMLVYFATQILLPDASSQPTEMRTHYFDIRRQFFCFLGLLMLWIVGVDFMLGSGFTSAGIINLVGFVIFAGMASTSNPRIQGIGTVVAWLFFIVVTVAKGIGVVG